MMARSVFSSFMSATKLIDMSCDDEETIRFARVSAIVCGIVTFLYLGILACVASMPA